MEATSTWIDIRADDGAFQAYLALPRGGKGPGIVLLQEIFGVNAHIRSLADQGKAVVVISSYMPEVMALADRILVSHQGKIVEEFSNAATESEIMYAAIH